MKKLLFLALLTTLLAACDDFPFHDEGWHGRGHWKHGDDLRSADRDAPGN